MGIDGISGGGGPPKVGPSAQAGRPSSDFSIEGGQAPVADADLAKLESGEITRDEYLDIRVDAAVSHLRGDLSSEQLELVRETLRDQLESDPMLQRLLQRATGVAKTDNDG